MMFHKLHIKVDYPTLKNMPRRYQSLPGCYLHGKLAEIIGWDLCLIRCKNIAALEDGQYPVIVHTKTRHYHATMYFWHGSQLLYRGLIVLNYDKINLADAQNKFKERRKII